ncbi:hypothetical protein GCM10011415_19010 [Salipiger pallidus]|uniref:Rhamnogalacturonase A/B/Epimerase-like pectate lyase domain-containing protein n=1 Tax=Salipiger pallidus TaxID=1775170 RepID=A0A8J2ZJ79_9RHOB|nr:glycosyl hydrolase family 28-related protein [Salipiger pallidus]GGG71371.1 hypothetical protein GCM10011415_19010 [Salipiger pallidus]
MNMAVTDGVVFMPTPFSDGLDVWSSGDGTPGSDTYESLLSAAYVPADADFAGCLEIQKTESLQKLRYMGNTRLLPGVYLKVTARVKAIAGLMPSVRIAGWAGQANGSAVTGLVTTGALTQLDTYGEVVEVSAIVGNGARDGVDLVWGGTTAFGHFGIDLTGSNGGIVRVDDIIIEDVTNYFLRDMMNVVDVRDYGAVGDGTADDFAAFEAADAAANGRKVLVSEGTFRIGQTLTMESHVEFQGTVVMPDSACLSLTKDYHLPAYIDAFGSEEMGLKKALQSLMNSSDHESLDMCGRRVSITGPIDVRAVVNNRDSYSQRRVLRNGQLRAESSTGWNSTTVTSTATYSAGNRFQLTGVSNIANIEVGSYVQGAGVGREIYVTSVNVGAQRLNLSQPLYDAEGTQAYTFTRFRYQLDLSGFSRLDKFEIEDVEFQCNELCSGLILPPTGTVNVVRDCVFNKPLDRGITSIGEGCQGMLIDNNQFITAQAELASQNRTSIALNTNANDVKIRSNRASQFRHFAVVSGGNGVIANNHFFQGEDSGDGARTAGIVLCTKATNTTISGNYVDNCFIEWTNEREPDPNFVSGFGFSGLSVTGNVFLCSNVADHFTFIVVKPYGTNHRINGMNVQGNLFRSVGQIITRVESVDDSFAPLDLGSMRDIFFDGNTYLNISRGASNPLMVKHSQNAHNQTWVVNTEDRLPFEGRAQEIESMVIRSRPRNTSNVTVSSMPYVSSLEGSNRDRVHVVWPEPVMGDVTMRIRMDY